VLPTEVPYPSDAFADSAGINVSVSDSTPTSEIQILSSRLAALGVRHLRAGIVNSDPVYDQYITELLGANNAKLDGITDCPGIEYYSTSPTSPAQIQQFDAAIGNALEDVEGPDEVDLRNDANWVSDTLNCLPSLRSAEPNLPFLAPTVADVVDNTTKLGNVSSDVTDGNMHRYFSGHNPGSAGWGGEFPCGKYGNVYWAICESRINSGPSTPVLLTETGYNSVSEVDEATQAKYLSREFLVNLEAGISRSYVFTLVDISASGGFSDDGLLRTDYSEKPAFAAVANEIGYFADRGSPTAEQALMLSVSSPVSGINHLLFKRRDGTYILALWNEATSWNTSTNQEIVVAPQEVTVTLATPSTDVSAVALNDAGGFVTKAVSTSANGIVLPIDDHVTLLSFKIN
jgi:hypothetical protein